MSLIADLYKKYNLKSLKYCKNHRNVTQKPKANKCRGKKALIDLLDGGLLQTSCL